MLGALGIEPGECLEVRVEGGAQVDAFVVASPFAPRVGRAHDRALQDVPPYFLELLDTVGERLELGLVLRPHHPLPFRDDVADAIIVAAQAGGIGFRGRDFGRHENAACLHLGGIDQGIDALDVHGAGEGRFELVGECHMLAGIEDGDDRKRRP